MIPVCEELDDRIGLEAAWPNINERIILQAELDTNTYDHVAGWISEE